MIKQFIFEDVFPETPGYPCKYEIWRKDAKTAQKDILWSFGKGLKIKLVSEKEMTAEQHAAHVKENMKLFPR
jgi:hypothetical protein